MQLRLDVILKAYVRMLLAVVSFLLLAEELSLLQRQEAYIAQLEKETSFCRDQLSYVLKHVKDVLREQETQSRSDDVHKAISNIFTTINGWQQNNVIDPKANAQGGSGSQESSAANLAQQQLSQEITFLKVKFCSFLSEQKSIFIKNFSSFQAENHHLKEQVLSKPDPAAATTSPLLDKFKQDNVLLSEALKKVRDETEEVRKREDEAVEQVKNSVQVAEQLRMEKTEMEYEIGQLKLQIERQQARIRVLIEEQVVKIDEEREIIEHRSQNQVKMVREELSKQSEEIGKMTSEVERQQRAEMELRRQVQDRDKIIDNIRHDTEKRLGQLQLEMVSIASARGQMEEEMNGYRIDLEHAEHELKTERSRCDAEIKSVRSRLAKSEEMLMKSRQECLETAEIKATLERELGLAKIQLEGSNDNSLNNTRDQLNKELARSMHEKDLSHQMTVAKLEELIRRQSHIIGELKHQCTVVTDRLEDSVKSYERDQSDLQQSNQRLLTQHEKMSSKCGEMEAQLAERGQLQEKLCRRLEELDAQKGEDIIPVFCWYTRKRNEMQIKVFFVGVNYLCIFKS